MIFQRKLMNQLPAKLVIETLVRLNLKAHYLRYEKQIKHSFLVIFDLNSKEEICCQIYNFALFDHLLVKKYSSFLCIAKIIFVKYVL